MTNAEVQQIAKQTMDFIKLQIKVGMNFFLVLGYRRICFF